MTLAKFNVSLAAHSQVSLQPLHKPKNVECRVQIGYASGKLPGGPTRSAMSNIIRSNSKVHLLVLEDRPHSSLPCRYILRGKQPLNIDSQYVTQLFEYGRRPLISDQLMDKRLVADFPPEL
jgi:hypothetical protein